MITFILTSETINYQKLLTYLEKHKQKAIDEMDGHDIKDITYSSDGETLVQRVMYHDNTHQEYEHEYFEFTDEQDGITIPYSIAELVNEHILDIAPYMYMLYDDEYDWNETNVKLLGFATTLEIAIAMVEAGGDILATTPNKSIDMTIYTEIDYGRDCWYDDEWYDDEWYDDDPYYG